MMRVPCPWCGPRDEDEFRYGGAGVPTPLDEDAITDDEWVAYLYLRDNSKGPLAERWVHAAGCRRWFTVLRDTTSHEWLGT